jgi:hypothetical protein
VSDNDLLEQEEQAGQHDDLGIHPERQEAETEELESLYNSSPDEGEPDGGGLYKSEPKGKPKLRTKAQAIFSGKKGRRRLIIMGALGGSSIMLIFLIVFLISSFTIPNFMSHVVGYQFTRTAREFAQSSEEIQGEKIMLDTAKDGTGTAEQGFFRGMLDRYQGVKDGVWDKVNSYRPEKVVDNLETTGQLSYVYEDGVSIGGFTRQKLVKVIQNGDEIDVANPTLAGRLLHPIQNFTDKIEMRGDLKDSIDESLDGTNTLVRSGVAKEIRSRIDATLVRWVRNGKPEDPINPAAYEADAVIADRLNAQESEAVATDNGTALRSAASEEVLDNNKDAENAAADGTEACVKDPACLDQQIADGNPTPRPVLEKIDAALQSDTLTKATSVISTAAAVAIPLCLIYDGSLQNSGSSIDTQTASNMRTYNSVAAANHQQQAGQNVTASAVNALQKQLQGKNGIGASVPEQRANNQPVDTTQFSSTQASASHSFSLINAIPLVPQSVLNFMDSFAHPFCKTITNGYVLAGLGIGEVVVGIASGGSVNLADVGIKEFVTTSVKQFFDEFSTKEFIKGVVVQGAVIGGATLIAKQIVASRAASYHNGLARGESFAAEVDAGGNATANYQNQGMFYGAPMNNIDVAMSAQEDLAYMAHQESQKPFTERYFALTNPNSLLTKFGTMAASYTSLSAVSRLLSEAGQILNPLKLFGTVLSHWGTGKALAASDVDTTNYGQVQFGWPPDEENKIASDASYQHPLENQLMLDSSGKEDEIASKYGHCFTDTIGTLLSKGYIQRDTNGNVLRDQGECSPNNVSYSNSQYGDLVFRWRIAKRHQNTLDHMLDIQNVQAAP